MVAAHEASEEVDHTDAAPSENPINQSEPLLKSNQHQNLNPTFSL